MQQDSLFTSYSYDAEETAAQMHTAEPLQIQVVHYPSIRRYM